MPGELEHRAFQMAREALAHQAGVLSELRGRTGTLLAASSLVASFLGGRALDGGVGLSGGLALAAFFVSMVASVYILLPKRGMAFTLEGAALLKVLYDVRDQPAEIDRRLTHWLDDYHERNNPQIQALHRAYEIAAGALLAEVLLWTADLAAILA